MVISFSRHKGTEFGHIIERSRHGYPSRYRYKRVKVRLIDGRWINEYGRDVHKEVTEILIASYINSRP